MDESIAPESMQASEISDDDPGIREILIQQILSEHKYLSRNWDYYNTLPKSHLIDDRDGTICDYEPHCYGTGNYDDPDTTPFAGLPTTYYRVPCESIRVTSCKQLISLIHADEIVSVAYLNEMYTPASTDHPIATALTVDWFNEIKTLVVNCKDWCRCELHHSKCLSVSIMALLLKCPNLEAIQFDHLSWDSSLFANFPSPTPLVSDEFDIFYMKPIISRLKTLSFYKSTVPTEDVLYLCDCCTDGKVLPNLRNLRFYYCYGMSYPSITSVASYVLNLDFDRWEMSGWCWPQENNNPKNHSIHC